MAGTSTALTVIGAPESSLGMHELPNLLKRWMTLHSDLTTLLAEAKEKKSQSKALRDMILKIMEKNSVVQLNVTKGAVIHKTREKKESLSTDYLRKTAETFFEGDAAKADALVKFLEENRTKSVVHDLRFSKTKESGL
jgi:hypothetical protein